VSEFWALLGQFIGRPSLLWRLAWLVFCLVVMVLFGARTLSEIAPSVISGATSSPPKSTPSATPVPRNFGPLVTWILPALVWIFILAGTAHYFLWR
jgi:hypothetical protein